ncbi:MAG: hypothetical protein ACJ8AI_08600 [Rhodopila sp.]
MAAQSGHPPAMATLPSRMREWLGLSARANLKRGTRLRKSGPVSV